jgi:HD superfamily phosphodiesterase
MKEAELINEMINYYAGDSKRVNHFLKVYAYAQTIAKLEKVDFETLKIIEVASILHDIGIKESERIYGDATGKHQEELGPKLAEKLLNKFDYSKDFCDRVIYLIGNHHSYNKINGVDFQILVESDFLVNLYEENSRKSMVCSVESNIFKTKTGKRFLKNIFL